MKKKNQTKINTYLIFSLLLLFLLQQLICYYSYITTSLTQVVDEKQSPPIILNRRIYKLLNGDTDNTIFIVHYLSPELSNGGQTTQKHTASSDDSEMFTNSSNTPSQHNGGQSSHLFNGDSQSLSSHHLSNQSGNLELESLSHNNEEFINFIDLNNQDELKLSNNHFMKLESHQSDDEHCKDR